jgi:uncharacterized protein (TIRG00374 family)
MEKPSVVQQIKLNKIIYPVLIGLGVVVYMIYSDINSDKLLLQSFNRPLAEKWYGYTISEDNQRVEINITDSLLLHLDSLSFQINYWSGKLNTTKFHQDTVLIYQMDKVLCNLDYPMYSITCFPPNRIIFEFREPLRNVLNGLNINFLAIVFLIVAAFMMIIRDFGYTWRIKVLTDNQLGWRKSLKVILLWEFTSALTPSAIGGSAVAILFLNKEGIRLGRSTAVVMASIFLDEMYFLVFVPLMILLVGMKDLFSLGSFIGEGASIYNEFFYFALIGYLVIFVFTAFLAYGLFVNPRGFKWLLIKVFRFKWFRRWLQGAAETGNEIMVSSRELRQKNFAFWAKASLGTFFSWTARYWIVNFLLLAFFVVDEHLLIFARQLIMWIMMLVSPTPGGSGFSEYVFATYLGDFIPSGLETALALLWRFITYYPYLFIGAFLFPRWVKTKFGKFKRA